MARVLLGVTGSVAAIHTPLLFDELRRAGHEVKVVATRASRYFFDPELLGTLHGRIRSEAVVLDEDEWPGDRYQRGDPVLHIELRRWADAFLIAPLDANTLAKLANGLADNCLTCVWRAWDRGRPVILAPAMNTLMWEHPFTERHLRQVAEGAGLVAPAGLEVEGLMAWVNQNSHTLTIVSPISKRLACDDVGVGAMAERADVVAAVKRALMPKGEASA